MHRESVAGMTTGAKLRCRASLLMALCLPILLWATPARSQAPGTASPQRHVPRRYRRVSIDDQVKGLAKSLDLNEAQQSAVKKILQQRQQATLRIQRDSSGANRISRLRALQVQTATQIRTVLNDEQRKKYNPLGQRPPQPTQPSVEDWMKATRPH
jgi:Spy/CpxP family protein refolding chaperone